MIKRLYIKYMKVGYRENIKLATPMKIAGNTRWKTFSNFSEYIYAAFE